jgi:hypothetical protein
MAGEGKSTILIAAISAVSAIVIALITTYGTIAVSAPKAEKVKKDFDAKVVSVEKAQDDFDAKFDSLKKDLEEISELQLIANLPVGTIVPSMLRPSQFAEVVGDPSVFDPKKSKWALADSQDDISFSRYGKLNGEKLAPDLRGMFLRGMNEGRDDGKQDPQDDRDVGDYQADSYKKHNHLLPISENKGNIWGVSYSTQGEFEGDHYRWTKMSGEKETRPKNVAVYFYIKIN